MGLFRTALIGAAIYGAYKYITKPDELTGRTILDDFKDKAPEWMDKAKTYVADAERKFKENNLREESF